MWRVFHLLLQSVVIVQCLNINETGLAVKTKFNFRTPAFASGNQPPYTCFLYHCDLTVDKTLFVKNLIEDKGKLFLITCPSQWGKTINVNMLKAFFEIEPDSEGNPLPYNETQNYRLFVGGEGYYNEEYPIKLRKPFLIANHPHIIQNYLARYPVVYVELLTSLIDKDFSSIVSSLARCIYVPFSQNRYVQNIINKTLQESDDENEKAQARAHLKLFDDFKFRCEWLDPDIIQKSLRLLSEILHKYLKKKVIVLMDRYDRTWYGLFLHESFIYGERQKIINFYIGFIKETFLNNPHVEKGILMGQLQPSEELHQAVFHQMIECNPLNGKFMEYFGLNQFEMQHLIPYLNVTEDEVKKLKEVYNGHKINHRDLHIYNPYDVAEFSYNRTISHFWLDFMNKNVMILNCIRVIPFKQRLYNLLNGTEVIIKTERDYFTWKEYDVLIKAMERLTFIHADLADQLYLMLYHVGFLTISEDIDITSPIKYFSLKIPNSEIHSKMKEMLRIHLFREKKTTRPPTTTTTEKPTTPDLSI